LSSTAASVTFSGIPSGYKHLQIRSTHQLNLLDSDYGVRFNGDSGANYTKHQIFGNGEAAYSTGTTGLTAMPGGQSQSTASSYFGGAIIDVLDYANVSKNKTIRVLGGSDANGSGAVLLRSGVWLNTSAITSITLVAQSGASLLNVYSSFALYGVK
jgi:hypothetical protein